MICMDKFVLEFELELSCLIGRLPRRKAPRNDDVGKLNDKLPAPSPARSAAML